MLSVAFKASKKFGVGVFLGSSKLMIGSRNQIPLICFT